MTQTTTPRVHFMGSVLVGRSACGRLMVAYYDAFVAPAWTADPAAVTCRACRKAAGNAALAAARADRAAAISKPDARSAALAEGRAANIARRSGREAEADMTTAEILARATGSVGATVTHERRALDGSLTVESVETYDRTRDDA